MSNLWHALYADDIPKEQTLQECDFIEYFLPQAIYPSILDLACGTGRHSLELAQRGYLMTGVDMDAKALQVGMERAHESETLVNFIAADLRELDMLDRQFDGVLLFWQSFGYFSDNDQALIFADLRRLLRPHGRLILDLYNRLHFIRGIAPEARPGADISLQAPIWGTDSYLTTPFSYEEDLRFERQRTVDLFDPHLFTPGEIAGLAANHDFHLIASCSGFHKDIPATPEYARMQLVFESSKSRISDDSFFK